MLFDVLQKMKIKSILIGLASLASVSIASSAVIYFEPSGISNLPGGANGSLYWDMFSDHTSTSEPGFGRLAMDIRQQISSDLSVGIIVTPDFPAVEILSPGSVIGASSNLDYGLSVRTTTLITRGRNGNRDQPSLIGLAMLNRGATYYGWAEVAEGDNGRSVFRWAYESVAETPIQAGQVPEPESVMLLLLGSWVISRTRRRS